MKKPIKVKYGDDWFKENKRWFTRSFLLKGTLERSKSLEEYYQKSESVITSLHEIQDFLGQRTKAPDKKKVSYGETKAQVDKAQELLQTLYRESVQIFSEDYAARIYTADRSEAYTPHLIKTHEMIGIMRRINQMWLNHFERIKEKLGE
ncbi:MAG: hypothetical protein ABID38_00600 [Candidatus Diapherotrites archaeon]